MLGTTTAGGALALSGCSTDRVEKLVPYLVQSEDQVPGVADLVREHLHRVRQRVRRARADPRGPRGEAGGQPRPSGQPGQALLPRPGGAAGAVQPGADPGPDGARQATAAWRRSPGTTRSRRLAGKLGEAGGRVAVLTAAGRGSFTDFLTDWTGALGGKLVRYETFDHEPVRAANRQVFGLDQMPAHDFAKARYIVSFGADFLESWGTLDREPARLRPVARVRRRRGGQVRLRRAADGPHRPQRRRVAPDQARLRGGAGARHGQRAARRQSDAPAGLASALGPYTPAMAAAETGVPAERIERLAREFAAARPSLAVAGGVGAQHAAATEVCAAVNVLNYVAGNVGRDGPLRGRSRRWPTATPALARLAQAIDGGRGRGAAGARAPTRSTPCPRRAGSPTASRKVAFKVSTVGLYLDETAAECDLVLPEHHALERWDDLRPRAGVYGPDAAGDGAGLRCPAAPATSCSRVSKKAGGAAGPLHRADAGRPTSRPAGRRWRPSWSEADAAGFWHAARAARRRLRDAPAAPAVALALREAPDRATPSPASRATGSSSS